MSLEKCKTQSKFR